MEGEDFEQMNESFVAFRSKHTALHVRLFEHMEIGWTMSG
jgi:hypothetical protein